MNSARTEHDPVPTLEELLAELVEPWMLDANCPGEVEVSVLPSPR